MNKEHPSENLKREFNLVNFYFIAPTVFLGTETYYFLTYDSEAKSLLFRYYVVYGSVGQKCYLSDHFTWKGILHLEAYYKYWLRLIHYHLNQYKPIEREQYALYRKRTIVAMANDFNVPEEIRSLLDDEIKMYEDIINSSLSHRLGNDVIFKEENIKNFSVLHAHTAKKSYSDALNFISKLMQFYPAVKSLPELDIQHLGNFIDAVNRAYRKEHEPLGNTFKWLNKPQFDLQVSLLYSKMNELGIIDDRTTEGPFKLAFSGTEIYEPLKIHFLNNTKNPTHKGISKLFYLLNKLADAGFLAPEQVNYGTGLTSRIDNIFVDRDGKKFKNLKKSQLTREEVRGEVIYLNPDRAEVVYDDIDNLVQHIKQISAS